MQCTYGQQPIGHSSLLDMLCVLFSVVQTIGHSSLLDMLCVLFYSCVCILLWLAQSWAKRVRLTVSGTKQECKYFWSVFFSSWSSNILISYMCVCVYMCTCVCTWSSQMTLCGDVSLIGEEGKWKERREGKGSCVSKAFSVRAFLWRLLSPKFNTCYVCVACSRHNSASVCAELHCRPYSGNGQTSPSMQQLITPIAVETHSR